MAHVLKGQANLNVVLVVINIAVDLVRHAEEDFNNTGALRLPESYKRPHINRHLCDLRLKDEAEGAIADASNSGRFVETLHGFRSGIVAMEPHNGFRMLSDVRCIYQSERSRQGSHSREKA